MPNLEQGAAIYEQLAKEMDAWAVGAVTLTADHAAAHMANTYMRNAKVNRLAAVLMTQDRFA